MMLFGGKDSYFYCEKLFFWEKCKQGKTISVFFRQKSLSLHLKDTLIPQPLNTQQITNIAEKQGNDLATVRISAFCSVLRLLCDAFK